MSSTKKTATPRRYLSITELCARWGLSRSTIWRGQKDGRYPPSVNSSLRRSSIPLEDVELCEQGWLAERANRKTPALEPLKPPRGRKSRKR